MKKIVSLLVAAFSIFSLCAQQEFTLNMSFDDTTRSFIVRLPPAYTAGSHLPLVFNFHGLSTTNTQQKIFSNMNPVADANGFIVVYPNALNYTWNAGISGHYMGKPKDVGFVIKMIDTLHLLYGVDLTRVYACGMSNGGHFSYRLACQLSDRIAAIASVGGTMTDSTWYYCNPGRYVPVLQMHGTDDSTVLYFGENNRRPVEDAVGYWLNANQCSATNDTVFVANTNLADSSTVQQIRYRTCGGGSEVWFYKIPGGGHTWPGSPVDLSFLGLGHTNKDIDASQEIWNFFNRFTINGPVGVKEIDSRNGDIQIYPNPTTDYVQIESYATMRLVEVYNMLGEKVKEQADNSTRIIIDLQSLPAGVYFMKTYTGNTYTAKKVIKN